MKDTLVIFYSYSGHTRELAGQTVGKLDADLFEVKAKGGTGFLKAYVRGPFEAPKQKRATIEPITAPLDNYKKIIVMGPIWRDWPAPAVNSILYALPKGAAVEVWLLSTSGHSSDKAKSAIKEMVA